MSKYFLVVCLVALPAICSSATGPDLRSRIRIDGRVTEYTPDEWVLDASSDFAERPRDSRWGTDNDIHRIAVTWDEKFLYIAVEGAIHSSAIMAFLEHTSGGAADLVSAGALRRNVVFAHVSPNMIIKADKSSQDAEVAVVSIVEPLRYLDVDAYESRFFQPSPGNGALEIALPWSEVLPRTGLLRLLAIVTAGVGTGAGDAAPDPSAALEFSRESQAHLDNSISIPVDYDRDGVPDMGVRPRDAVHFGFEQQAPESAARDIHLQLQTKSFAPDDSQSLRFRITAEGGDTVDLYVTCEVYSVAGERVRVLFTDERRVFVPGVEPTWDQWDGRNDRGEIVPGGLYIVHVSSGASSGVTTNVDRQSAAVIR
jgi:hypothetical protein